LRSQSTTKLKLHENLKSPITPTKIVESKWRYNMINYTYHDQLPTKYESCNFGPMRSEVLLPNMQGIRPSISEELHSQSEAGRTNEQTVKLGPNTIYRMRDL
jgi:hypothetical protein